MSQSVRTNAGVGGGGPERCAPRADGIYDPPRNGSRKVSYIDHGIGGACVLLALCEVVLAVLRGRMPLVV